MSKKALYFSLLFAVLILIGFFIGRVSSGKNEDQEAFSMQQKCNEVGSSLYEKDLEGAKSANFSLGNPQYHYNKELNTCLYFNILVTKDSFQKWIKDSLSNKELVSVIETNGKLLINKDFCDTCVTNEEFEIRKNKLFDQ